MDSLDLNIEEGVRVDRNLCCVLNVLGKFDLSSQFDFHPLIRH